MLDGIESQVFFPIGQFRWSRPKIPSTFRSWSPFCYHLTYVRGLIFEARGQFEDARQCYENTLSVNPTHLCSLYHLGRVYYQLGFYRLSEQTLKVR